MDLVWYELVRGVRGGSRVVRVRTRGTSLISCGKS